MRKRGTARDTKHVREWQDLIKPVVLEMALADQNHELTVSDIQVAIMNGKLPAPPEISDVDANQGAAFSNVLRNFGFKATKKTRPSKFPPSKYRKVTIWYLPWEEMCGELFPDPNYSSDDVWLA